MPLTVGVDVGGTKIAGGVVDESGAILATARRESPATDREAISIDIADLVAELRGSPDITAVGIGAAGFVDSERSTVMFAPNLAWRDEPLRRDLEERTGLHVVVENDANAAACRRELAADERCCLTSGLVLRTTEMTWQTGQ